MKSTPLSFRLLSIVFCALTISSITSYTITSVRSVEIQQSCEDVPQGGGESISANISIRNTGQPLSNNGFAPSSTWIDINALATAFGQCIGMGLNCQPSPCICQENGTIYERTVNHIGVYVDISTSGSLNGTYVNRTLIDGEVSLRHGDEVQIGKFRMIYFASPTGSD